MRKITCYVKDGAWVTRLRKMALQKGCVVQRGPYVGRGDIGKLLQQIAEGKLTVIRLSKQS